MIDPNMQAAADQAVGMWRRAKLFAAVGESSDTDVAGEWDIDLTYRDLKALGESPNVHVQVLMEYLRSVWVGDTPDREWNCRAGTMRVWVDAEGSLHMDFTPRAGGRPADLLDRLSALAQTIKSEESRLSERGMGVA